MRRIRHKLLVIADSGYWAALGNTKDRYHHRAKDVLTRLTDIPVTTWPVITETAYLLQRSGGWIRNWRFCVLWERVLRGFSTWSPAIFREWEH